MVVSNLMDGGETWVPAKRDKFKVQAAEIRCLIRVKDSTIVGRISNDGVQNAQFEQ